MEKSFNSFFDNLSANIILPCNANNQSDKPLKLNNKNVLPPIISAINTENDTKNKVNDSYDTFFNDLCSVAPPNISTNEPLKHINQTFTPIMSNNVEDPYIGSNNGNMKGRRSNSSMKTDAFCRPIEKVAKEFAVDCGKDCPLNKTCTRHITLEVIISVDEDFD